MQNVIDMCNHILCHSTIYCGFEEMTDDMQHEAIGLSLKYGDFAVGFVRVYLDIQEEIRNECY